MLTWSAESRFLVKQRLDLILVERGIADSRTKAQALIMAGIVSSNGRLLDKVGQTFDTEIELAIKSKSSYVSRAGDKLASVAQELGLDFSDKIVLDVGSSTGGFTDFALQNGAKKVYCVDVGSAQLAYKLRKDPRIIIMEKTDIRTAALPEKVDVVVIDVSFISLKKILDAVVDLTKDNAPIVCMLKPQFEAGREIADKYKGVIPLGEDRDNIISDFKDWSESKFRIINEADSRVPGTHGNVEHFINLLKR